MWAVKLMFLNTKNNKLYRCVIYFFQHVLCTKDWENVAALNIFTHTLPDEEIGNIFFGLS